MTSGLAASTDRHYGAAMTNLEGPDPKLVVRNQLINAHQYLLAARQDKSVPNSVGSALLSLHAAVKALADVVLDDDQNGPSAVAAPDRRIARCSAQPGPAKSERPEVLT